MTNSNCEKWNLALSLFIESLYKPDSELRNEATGLECLQELMDIRQDIIEHASKLRVRQ